MNEFVLMTEKKLIAKVEGRMQIHLWVNVPLLLDKSKCLSYSSASEIAQTIILIFYTRHSITCFCPLHHKKRN